MKLSNKEYLALRIVYSAAKERFQYIIGQARASWPEELNQSVMVIHGLLDSERVAREGEQDDS